LYPDHTLLLSKNEAFLVINGDEVTAEEIIAMRVSICWTIEKYLNATKC
jgi:hypothetical protein